MNIKHNEIIPNEKIPFSECKLKREPYSKILTQIVYTYSDGFVLAINNEWGTGKTTFVKMWQQQLKNEGFQTVYFNAWENDFDTNPLVAIMAELERLIGADEHKKKIFESVLEKGGVLINNIAPALAKSLIKKYIVDIDEIALGVVENTTKASTEILKSEIKEYSSKKKTIIEFKTLLEKFVNANGKQKPLVFIIDELDRCRPNYSVEVLEQVKHLFSVRGIVFVLSIDKSHLASAVKGFYGSENINTDEYLRRFIDLEYSIPEPSVPDFIAYLFTYFDFREVLLRLNASNDQDLLLKTAELLFLKSNAKLRQQEKIFALLRLILQSFSPNHTLLPHLLMFLVFIRTLHQALFKEIATQTLSLKELAGKIEKLFPSDVENVHNLNVIHLQAELLFLYYNRRDNYQRRFKDESVNEKRELNEELRSSLQSLSDGNILKNYFDAFNNQMLYRRMDLDYLLTKINLLEPIQI